ncbi:unnamed protein product, partial [marine sediment metagenome]
MEYPTIESFTYRELQKLVRSYRDTIHNSINIKLNVSKETLYDQIRDSGYLPYNMDAISVYILPEIIEYILSFSEDDMYTIFALTSKYWYDKSRSDKWWEKRYLQLGGYLPPENTIPPKLLYNQMRCRYANVLVKIEGELILVYSINIKRVLGYRTVGPPKK